MPDAMPQAQMQAERKVAIIAPRDERWQGRISRNFRFHNQPTFETVRGSAVQRSSRGAMMATSTGLLAAAPQQMPAFPQPGLHRIFRDVTLEPPELGFMPHQVVKSILLPKPPLRSKTAIDPHCRKMLP